MFFTKIWIKYFLCLVAFFFNITPASSAIVHITISGLDNQDLAAFDFNASWDSTGDYYYDSYTLTEHLGQFSLNEAENLSTPYVTGSNSLNLSVISYLQDLDAQPDAFTLASLRFYGNQDPTSDIELSDIILSDQFGNAISLDNSTIRMSVVPLPGSIWLMGFSLLSLSGLKKWKTGSWIINP
jgi:hypothetical protein